MYKLTVGPALKIAYASGVAGRVACAVAVAGGVAGRMAVGMNAGGVAGRMHACRVTGGVAGAMASGISEGGSDGGHFCAEVVGSARYSGFDAFGYAGGVIFNFRSCAVGAFNQVGIFNVVE